MKYLFLLFPLTVFASPPQMPPAPVAPDVITQDQNQDQGQDQNQTVLNEYNTNIYTPCHGCTNITEVAPQNNTEYDRAIAAVVAMTNIPSISHEASEHGHLSVGAGVGRYGNGDAVAVGINYQIDRYAFKVGAAKAASTSASYGAGFSISF